MPWKGGKTLATENKINFVVTINTGDRVKVTYSPDFLNHLEFRGKVSETGYRSDFPFPVDAHPSLDEVKKRAGELAQNFYNKNPAKYGIQKHLF